MKLLVILFALFAIIIFCLLAVKKGSQNRKEIEDIERTEKGLSPDMSDEEESAVSEKGQAGIIGSLANINNSVGKTLKGLGIIILFAGTIIGFCYAENETAGFYSLQYGFSFLQFFTCELITCFAGFLFIGLGEIIRLLDIISKKTK